MKMACCHCLNDPRGEYRSKGQKITKLIMIFGFLIACSQLFPLLYNFIRLLCYSVLDPREYPPKPLPRRFSFFGIDLLQYDRQSSESLSALYLSQSIGAVLLSVLYMTLSNHALINERFTLLTFQAIELLVIVCVTLFGAVSFRALIPLKNIALPVIGCSIGSLIQILFRFHYKPAIHYSGNGNARFIN